MDKVKIALLIFAIIMTSINVVLVIMLYQQYIAMKSLQNQEYFIIKSANFTYENYKSILYIHIVNTGAIPVKIKGVKVYYEVPDIEHYVGESYFIEESNYSVVNFLIVLYGSNPIPPKYEAFFKANPVLSDKYLMEDGFLKPGTYIINVLTDKDTKVFSTIVVSGEKKVNVSIQKYSHEIFDFIVYLDVKNVGDRPFVLPSNDLKVYLDGTPWKVFYDRDYSIAPGKEESVQITIPLQLVPYSDPRERFYPYVDLTTQTIGNLGTSEITVSMLKEHVIIIDVPGTKLEIRIPPVNMSCKVLDIGKTLEKSAEGQLWWHILNITLEVTSQQINQLDLGWFNNITISVDNLCDSFIVYKIKYTQKDSQTYIVTIYPSAAFYLASGKEHILDVYYGELKVASAKLN